MIGKKILTVVLTASVLCGLFTGCSGDGGGENKTGYNSSTENSKGKKNEGSENSTVMEEKTEKSVKIDSAVLNLLGDSRGPILNSITGKDIGAKIEENDDGSIQVVTETQKQRDSILDILSGFISDTASSFQKKGKDVKFSCDIQNGYIDIACRKEDAKDAESAVNSMAGYIAFARRICDNTLDWSAVVAVNDSQSGETVFRTSLSSESCELKIPEKSWDKQ